MIIVGLQRAEFAASLLLSYKMRLMFIYPEMVVTGPEVLLEARGTSVRQ